MVQRELYNPPWQLIGASVTAWDLGGGGMQGAVAEVRRGLFS